MRRGPVAGLVVMGLALVGCGAATLSEPGGLSVQAARDERLHAALSPPEPRFAGLRRPAVTVTENPAEAVPVADGETAVVHAPPPPPDHAALARLGPAPPRPAGPVWPGTEGEEQAGVAPGPVNIYSHTTSHHLGPAVADVPLRVYVPNSDAASVSVIDPVSLRVVDRFDVGVRPHHVTPSWDLTRLYVNNTEGNSLTVIDPRSGRPTATIPVTDPYNLYFTPDGSKAIVVAERYQRLDFYNPADWTFLKSVSIPWPGVDHADFSADGRYFFASTEFSGQVVKVDTESMTLVGRGSVGSLPIDVKMSPDGKVLYVANQGRHGVSLVDPETLAEIGFLRTGVGAHGLNVSRDAATLFVSNRMEGSISVIDFATRSVRTTWRVGGSPDMIQVSADGTRLWVSNRFHGSVSVVDTTTGTTIATIPTGAGAHGVSLFPQPGRYNVGHNGVYR
ncbi:MAG TPA: YncE family protein [Acidimicrobiales bacterium]|nr:YncE family protein [Acidimicrobiales bacterium]